MVRFGIPALVAAVAFGAGPALAEGETLSVSVATFENGRVVIAGTATPGAEVVVAGTTMADTADPASGAFRITRRTVLPACTVDLEAGEARAKVDVANCRLALMGVEVPQAVVLFRPRGPWNSGRLYRSDDVVEFQGRHWRAVRDGRGQQPGLAGTEPYWAAFDPAAVPETAGEGAALGAVLPDAEEEDATAEETPVAN